MKRISCPLDGCTWVLEAEEPTVSNAALAGVFGPGVMAVTALNQHHQEVEAQLREHFRGHELPDFLKTITRLNEALAVAHETTEHFGQVLAEERRTGANAVGMLAEAVKEVGRLKATHDRLLPVVEAAKAWRVDANMFTLDGFEKDLIAAVDALGTDAADGAGTGEPPCDMDTTRGICGRPAEVRHCHGDDHGCCCVEGTYLEQLDGVAVHRMDLSRAERRRVAWRVRARYANAETQTFDHEAHALAMNELDRLKAERPGSPFDAEPAASPAGSSTADEGAAR